MRMYSHNQRICFKSIDENASRRFIQKYFLKLGEGCQKILQLYAQGMSYRKIAENMGVTEKFVKKRKYECKEMLIEMIKKILYLKFTSMMNKIEKKNWKNSSRRTFGG